MLKTCIDVTIVAQSLAYIVFDVVKSQLHNIF